MCHEGWDQIEIAGMGVRQLSLRVLVPSRLTYYSHRGCTIVRSQKRCSMRCVEMKIFASCTCEICGARNVSVSTCNVNVVHTSMLGVTSHLWSRLVEGVPYRVVCLFSTTSLVKKQSIRRIEN
jgi:hypothetical protein